MEIKQIYDCQEVLDSVSKIKTEEELKCDQLLRNPNTIEWLGERKNNLDKEIKGIEDKILEKNGILNKKKAKENEKEKTSKILESKKNNLNNIKIAESDIKLQESLKSKTSEVDKKIKEYESDIYDKGQSKYKVDEEIKNKETNERNWEAHVSSARSELSSAETEFNSAQQRGSYNSCWGGYSPELSNACVQRYRNKIQEKQSTKESYERTLNNVRKELNEEREKSKKLSEDIVSLSSKKNEEIAKKAQYEKERKEVEVKIQGVLEQKKFLETDIEKQKAEQILINDALLSLEESAKNFDSDALKTQKGALEQNLKATLILEQDINVYLNTEKIQEEAQHQEL